MRHVIVSAAVVGSLFGSGAFTVGCSSSDTTANASGAPATQTTSGFAGSYTGTYSGTAYHGTLKMTVATDGVLSLTANDASGATSLGTGTLDASGAAQTQGGGAGFVFKGTFVDSGANATGSGAWSDTAGDTGTWSVTKDATSAGTETSTGTATADAGSGTTTSEGDGGGGATTTGATCDMIAGTYAVTGTCNVTSCVVSQTVCSSNFDCNDGTLALVGTVSGASAHWASGEGTCTAEHAGKTLTGTCTLGGLACSFTATAP